jgi:DNA-binding NtrC family response regulator
MKEAAMNLPTILVVDDEAPICRALARLLRGRYRVVSAGDAEAGLAAVAAERPSVAIVDYNLPGKKGDDLLREIRERHPDVRRVLLSGAPPPHVPALLDEGVAERFYEKPWPTDALLAFLEEATRATRRNSAPRE